MAKAGGEGGQLGALARRIAALETRMEGLEARLPATPPAQSAGPEPAPPVTAAPLAGPAPVPPQVPGWSGGAAGQPAPGWGYPGPTPYGGWPQTSQPVPPTPPYWSAAPSYKGPRWSSEPKAGAGRPPGSWPGDPSRPGEAGARPIAESFASSLGSFRDLESRLTGKMLAWVGAAAVILGVVFFLSLAFSRGWIGPEGRVAIGLAVGAAFLAAGVACFEQKRRVAAEPRTERLAQLGRVVAAVGLGVVSVSLFAGTRLYGIFPPETALAGSFVIALVAAAIAVRYDDEAVAAFGLVAALAAPPVMGASANLVTMGFLCVTLVGTTAVALARSWRWLPLMAFHLTAPQLAVWLAGRPTPALAISIIAGFWLLHALAAAADELHEKQPGMEWRATYLFPVNSLLAAGGGLFVLSDNLAAWQGSFLVGVALAQFAFGAYFVWKRGDRYPFGVFVNALGVAAVTLAIERQFDGPPVAIAWAIEAVVLAAILGWRRHVPAGGAAALVAALAVAHLCWYEYPIRHWELAGIKSSTAIPFADTAGLTLALLLVAAAAGGLLARRHDVRCALVTGVLLLVAYALPFGLDGMALLAGWAVLVPVSIASERLLDLLPGVPESRASRRSVPVIAMQAADWPDSPLLATVVVTFLAVTHFLAYDVPVSAISAIALPVVPFTDLMTVSALVGIAAFLVAGVITRRPDLRVAMVVLAIAVAAYTTIFELAIPFAVAGWCVLAAVAGALSLNDSYGRRVYLGTYAFLLALAAGATLWQVTPLERLGVQAAVVSRGPQFFLDASVAVGAIVAVLVAGALVLRLEAVYRHGLLVAAAAAIVYLLSVLVVDLFQGGVGGSTALEELQKQAQVAVSILWAALGMALFVAGIVRWRQMLREFGLALLAMATLKVFIFDLSYLDVAYRVLSLMGLGLLLLGGAYVFQSRRPRREDLPHG